MLDSQDRVSNEQEQQANEQDSQSTQVDHSSFCEDITVALVLLTRLRVVQSVVRLNIFWEEQ